MMGMIMSGTVTPSAAQLRKYHLRCSCRRSLASCERYAATSDPSAAGGCKTTQVRESQGMARMTTSSSLTHCISALVALQDRSRVRPSRETAALIQAARPAWAAEHAPRHDALFDPAFHAGLRLLNLMPLLQRPGGDAVAQLRDQRHCLGLWARRDCVE